MVSIRIMLGFLPGCVWVLLISGIQGASLGSSKGVDLILSLIDHSAAKAHQHNVQCKKEKEVCTSEACVHISSRILSMINRKVPPCQDFFSFACGGWQRANLHKIDDENLFYSLNINEMTDKLDNFISLLLKEKMKINKSFYDSLPYKNMKAFYTSCMNTYVIEEKGFEPVKALLKSLKAFQIATPFEDSKWNLTKAVLELIGVNGSPLFDVSFDTHPQNSSKWGLVITKPQHNGLIKELTSNHKWDREVKLRQAMNELLKKKGNNFIDKLQIGKAETESVIELFSKIREMNSLHKETGSPYRQAIPLSLLKSLTKDEEISSNAAEHRDVEDKSVDKSEGNDETPLPPHETTQLTDPLTNKDATASVDDASADPEEPPEVLSSIEDLAALLGGSQFENATNENEATIEDLTLLLPILDRTVLNQGIEIALRTRKVKGLSEIISTLSSEDYKGLFFLPHFENNSSFEKVIEFIMDLQEREPTDHEDLLLLQTGELYANNYTIEQLQKEFPIIEWSYLLSELLNQTVDSNHTLLVYYPKYMNEITQLITNSEPWLVHHGMLVLYIYDALKDLFTIGEDVKRETYCLQMTREAFPAIISHMYLNKIGKGKIKDLQQKLAPLITDLTQSMIHQIETSAWMSDLDINLAKKKIENIDWQIGALEKYADLNFIEENFSKVNFQQDQYFDNVLDFYKIARKELYNFYKDKVNKDILIWGVIANPFTLNAFHYHSTHSVVIPEAILRPPFYNPDAPRYIEYGSIGMVLAHEMFHAFDFLGTHFNHQGKFKKEFSDYMTTKMKERLGCFNELLDESFSEIVDIEGLMILLNIDKEATANENFADISGLRAAFEAYKESEKQHPAEALLPAMPYTKDQLFFLAYAQPYCGILPDIAKVALLDMDEHLPSDTRINSVLTNFPRFREAFSCKPSDKMASSTKTCDIF